MSDHQVISLIGFVVFPLLAFCFSPFVRRRVGRLLPWRKRAQAAEPHPSGPAKKMVTSGRYLPVQLRSVVPWRMVLWGLGLQIGLAVLLIATPLRDDIFPVVRAAANAIQHHAQQGAALLFGEALATNPTVLAISGLTVIILVGALTAMLYHLRILPALTHAFAWLMRRTMGVSGPESLGVASNILVGPVEAGLVIKPYLPRLTHSEMFGFVTAGTATIAGNMLVVYSLLGADAGHLLTASIISAPAAIMIAKLMIPETDRPTSLRPRRRVSNREIDAGSGRMKRVKGDDGPVAHKATTRSMTADGKPDPADASGDSTDSAAVEAGLRYDNLLHAAATGAVEGTKLLVTVAGVLLAFVALLSLADAICMALTGAIFGAGLTLSQVVGPIFQPFAALMGVPAQDIPAAAELLSVKTITNEFVAYQSLLTAPQYADLAPRTQLILTYALCSFANFGTIGIILGGVGELVSARRAELARFGLRAIIGGTLAAMMTACLASALISDEMLAERTQTRPVDPTAVHAAPADQPGAPGPREAGAAR
jgi:CNT family concentrative nucleoside transporter